MKTETNEAALGFQELSQSEAIYLTAGRTVNSGRTSMRTVPPSNRKGYTSPTSKYSTTPLDIGGSL